jgi:hypothetical protein
MKLEELVGLEKATIHQCQELAKKFGYDGTTFDLCGPKGKLKAKWLDAYMGLFEIEGQEGFSMTKQFEFIPDVWCENITPSEKL